MPELIEMWVIDGKDTVYIAEALGVKENEVYTQLHLLMPRIKAIRQQMVLTGESDG